MKLREYLKRKEKEALDKGLEKEAVKKILIECHYRSISALLADYDSDMETPDEIDPQSGKIFRLFNRLLSYYIDEKKPWQYICGYAYFYGRKFKVNENVLIPRPETELVTERAISIIKERKYGSVLDLGTGCGVMAITIAAAFPEIKVYASDIDADALSVAACNAEIHRCSHIKFIRSDLFDGIEKGTCFDMIVCNPPYLDPDESDAIDEIVYRNEPSRALFAGEKGVYFYRKIIEALPLYLKEGGTAVFEIGDTLGDTLSDIAYRDLPGYKVRIEQDYNRLDRILIIGRC